MVDIIVSGVVICVISSSSSSNLCDYDCYDYYKEWG